MPTKKQIITIGVLCVIALGLGYWSGMPEKGSGQRAEVVASTVITNVVVEVVTNIVRVPQPTPTPIPISPRKRLIAAPVVEEMIRKSVNKPESELTEADLDGVTILDLSDTKITDAGLKEVAKLQQLKYLDFSRTKITDAGLKDVAKAKLQKLELLWLHGTNVTDAGVAELKKALPNCRIFGP